jgi:hypothetical protein
MLGREYLEWLAALEPGDEVAVRQAFRSSQVLPVERVTPTQVLVGGRRYRRVPRRAGERVELAARCSGKLHPVEQADRESQRWGVTLTTLRERTSARSPEAMLDRALAEARRVAAESGGGVGADYAAVAEHLQGCLAPCVDPDDDVETRNAAAEGMIDALSGIPFEVALHPDGSDYYLRMALAYCGGYCLAAPGFGHAGAVRAIFRGDLP